MSVISIYINFIKPFSFSDFLMIEGNEQGALRKGPVIAIFVEQFKTTTLRKSYW